MFSTFCARLCKNTLLSSLILHKMQNQLNTTPVFNESSSANANSPSLKLAKRQIVLPLLVACLVLVGLNIGMNLLLAPKKPIPAATKPAAPAPPTPAPAAPAAAPAATQNNVKNNATWVSLMPKDANSGLGSAWVPISGQWKVEGSDFVQTKADGFDMTLSYREKKFSNFALRVNLKHDQGTGAGVLINMPDATRKNGAHVIRFTDDGKGIFWGYFDDNAVFVAQGFANATLPPNSSKKLEVQSSANAYAILLDGESIAKDVPLKSKTGHIALTNSVSVARFNSIETANLDGPAPTANAGFEAINGQWVQDDKRIEQRNLADTDFWISTGMLAGSYRVSAKITLKSPQSGGGFIFHMQDRNERKLAHMVRFSNGGNQIFWGSYNETGVFMGQGDKTLKPNPQSPNTHNLELIVTANSYDIVVDGEIIGKQIPLNSKNGWIGLLSYSGIVVFEDFYFQLGKII